MKNFCTGLMVFMFLFVVSGRAWAEKQGKTVAQQVNDVNLFNQVTDYFAGLGKSDVEKAAIKKEREEQRRIERLRALQHKKQLEVKKREKKIAQQNSSIKGWRAGSYQK